MGLLEFIGEGIKRGPVGDVVVDDSPPSRSSGFLAVLKGILAWAVLLAWTALIVIGIGVKDPMLAVGVLAISYFYLWLAHRVRPRPDDNNLGFAGGLIDHPFRISDDVNRLLVALWLFLLPGRWLASGLIGLARRARPQGPTATSLRR